MQSNNFFIQEIINRARVARLSTIDHNKQIPHIVPVVFAFDGHYYYIPLDNKRKEQAEFVPTIYQYNSFEQASQIVASALDVEDKERQRISDSVMRFSETDYKRQFQLIISKLIYNVNIDKQYNFPNFPSITSMLNTLCSSKQVIQ